MSEVNLLRYSHGEHTCPDEKVFLFTNINYNASEPVDILILDESIQLDQKQLESYDFIVEGHDGVSLVINNSTKTISLVSGVYLDGEVLSIPAGNKITSLLTQKLNGRAWNDATRSAVTMPVEKAELDVNLAINSIEVISEATKEVDINDFE